jgi:YebC/PmpR family DNA-binding regulatory protein
MSGHSQFHNIMYRKGAQDAKRAKKFAKISREITVAAKLGGNDATANPRLRAALALARENNMPKDNVERAMAKATNDIDSASFEDVRYEGYGPGGVAIIVETLTDNRNRTASEIRSAFTKFGGNLGETGSVAFSFNKLGCLIYKSIPGGLDAAFELAMNLGARDVQEIENHYIEILTDTNDFASIRDKFVAKFGEPIESRLIWAPTVYVPFAEDAYCSLTKLLDMLEDNDDVQEVFHNMESQL